VFLQPPLDVFDRAGVRIARVAVDVTGLRGQLERAWAVLAELPQQVRERERVVGSLLWWTVSALTNGPRSLEVQQGLGEPVLLRKGLGQVAVRNGGAGVVFSQRLLFDRQSLPVLVLGFFVSSLTLQGIAEVVVRAGDLGMVCSEHALSDG
jgi:hypothetical protein